MKIISYDNKEGLENSLVRQIVKKLEEAIIKYGCANILLSGGTTPYNLYQKLSLEAISWSKVNIGLVDERYVPISDAASNQKLLAETILNNHAAKAKFVGMIHDLSSRANNLYETEQVYQIFYSRLDVCLLGMGKDGHTASLFPSDEASAHGLNTHCKELVLYTTSPDAPQKRVSCSKNLLQNSKSLFLMITGDEKLQVLKNAEVNKLPIAHFFKSRYNELMVHYSK